MSIHWKPNSPELLDMCIERDLAQKKKVLRTGEINQKILMGRGRSYVEEKP